MYGIREVRDDDGLCNRGSREGMKSEVSLSLSWSLFLASFVICDVIQIS